MLYRSGSLCHVCRFLGLARKRPIPVSNSRKLVKRLHTSTDGNVVKKKRKVTEPSPEEKVVECPPLDPHLLNETLMNKSKSNKSHSPSNKIDIQKLVAFMFDEPALAGGKVSARDRIDYYGRPISKPDLDIEELLGGGGAVAKHNSLPDSIVDPGQLEKTIRDRQSTLPVVRPVSNPSSSGGRFMADIPEPLAMKLALGDDTSASSSPAIWINRYRKEYLTLGPDDALVRTKMDPLGPTSPYRRSISDDLFGLLLSLDHASSTWSTIGKLETQGWFLIGGRSSSNSSIPPLLVFSRFRPQYIFIKRLLFLFSSLLAASIGIRFLYI